MRVISLGFNLTPSLGNSVTPDRATSSTETVDPLLASPGTEHYLIPPETNPNAEETVDPLLPSTLQYPGNNSRPRVIKNLPKVKRHPYAGGTAITEAVGKHEADHPPETPRTFPR